MSNKKQVNVPAFDVLSFYNTDPNLEESGAVMKLPEDRSGNAYFLVRPFPNHDYNRRMAEAYQQNVEIFKKGGKEAEEIDREVTATVLAETILVGCGGMAHEYSKDFAIKCMKNNHIREKVISFASSIANYRIKDEEIEKK